MCIQENPNLNLTKFTGFQLGSLLAKIRYIDGLSDYTNEQLLRYLRSEGGRAKNGMFEGEEGCNYMMTNSTNKVHHYNNNQSNGIISVEAFPSSVTASNPLPLVHGGKYLLIEAMSCQILSLIFCTKKMF